MKKSDNPKIFIFGAGAIGSLFGCILSEKFDVTLINRQKYIEQTKKKGLKLTGFKNKIYHPKSTTQISQIPPKSLILVTTKAQDLKSSILAIKKKLKEDTVIVILQNGLNQEDEVRKIVSNRLIRLVTEQGSRFINSTTIRAQGPFTTYIEKGNTDVVNIFRNVKLPIKEVSDIRQKEWEKLMLNCVINSLGTILYVPNNQLNNSVLQPIKKMIKQECRQVANAEGFILDDKSFKNIEKLISTSTNINSTLQDIKKGKKTEIDYLNGMVVKLGKKYNIPTPANEMVWRMIKYMEKNKLKI